MLTKRKKFQRKITRSFDDLKRDPNIHKRFTIKLSSEEESESRIVFPAIDQEKQRRKCSAKRDPTLSSWKRGGRRDTSSRCIFRSLRWWRMAPGEAASRPSPVADNYLKGEGGREGEAEKSKGETDRKRGEAVGSGIGEARGGRGQKAKREVFWLAAKNRRERLSTAGRSVRVCERKDRKEEREGGEGRGKEKKRGKKKRKERKKEEKKNEEKEGKRKRSTHHHPLGFDETHACDPMAFLYGYPILWSLFP